MATDAKREEVQRELEKRIAQMADALQVFEANIDAITSYIWTKDAELSENDKHFLDLRYYLLHLGYEIRTHFHLLMMKHGEWFPVIEKYLALVEFEAIQTVPVVAGQLVRSLEASSDPSFDLAAVKASLKKYNMSVQTHLNELEAWELLNIVHNKVALPYLMEEQSLDGILTWHITSRKLWAGGITFLDSKFTMLAVALGKDLQTLADELDESDKDSRVERTCRHYLDITEGRAV